ncbi:MAG TPA: hypothetical protein VF359_05920 [Anaerolineales bacterium]
MGRSNPSLSAHAAPVSDDGGSFTFAMIAVPSAMYVCTGQTMTFSVTIYRQLIPQPGDTGLKFGNIQGVVPKVKPFDPNFGKIALTGSIVSPTNHKLETTEWTFTAGNNPGKMNIQFYADIPDYWMGNIENSHSGITYNVETNAPVDVRNCGYKVNIIFVGNIPDMLSWVASADEIRLTKDSETHFSGSAPYHQLEKILVHDHGYGPGIILCNKKPLKLGHWSGTISPTTVDYKADLAKDKLYLTVAIQQYINTATESCFGNSSTFGEGLSMTPTVLFFPLQGGVEVIEGTYGTYMVIVDRMVDP